MTEFKYTIPSKGWFKVTKFDGSSEMHLLPCDSEGNAVLSEREWVELLTGKGVTEKLSWPQFEAYHKDNKAHFMKEQNLSEQEYDKQLDFFRWCKSQGMEVREVEESLLKLLKEGKIKTPS